MTPADLDELAKLLSEGTPGPWLQAHHIGVPQAIVAAANPKANLLCLYSDADNEGLAVFDRVEDAASLVSLRNASPELLRLARLGMEAEVEAEKAFQGGVEAMRGAMALEAATEQRLYDECREKMLGGEREHAYCLTVLKDILHVLPEKPSLPPSPDTGGEK